MDAKLTIDDIRRKYKQLGKPRCLPLIWGYYYGELYLTKLFLAIDFSANQVTGVSFFLGVAGCLLMTLGGYYAAILGAVILNLWALLDYVDGNVARYKSSQSDFGSTIDLLNMHLIGAGSFSAIGLGITHSLKTFIGVTILPIEINPPFILLGFLATAFYLSKRLIKEYILFHMKSKDIENSEPFRKGKAYSLLGNLLSFERLYTPTILILALFKLLDIWLVITSTVFVFDAVVSSVLMVKHAHDL